MPCAEALRLTRFPLLTANVLVLTRQQMVSHSMFVLSSKRQLRRRPTEKRHQDCSAILWEWRFSSRCLDAIVIALLTA